MRVQRRFIALLMVAAFGAVAILGAASTTWIEALTASASVTTASLDGSVVCSSLAETDPNASVSPTSAADGNYHWQLGVSGMYPGYSLTCNYTIANTALVPWHVEALTIVVTDPASVQTSATCTLGGACTYTGTNFNITLPDVRGCQVHQTPTTGSTLTGAFVLTSTVAPATAATWTVRVTYQVNQWNDSRYSGCGIPR